jgi:FAD/FMN-containing dehydrogenase
MTIRRPNDPELVEFASQVGSDGPVTVAGGRTRWTLGGEVDPEARVVSAPTGIVEYQPAEMVVTVRAGTTVDELHTALVAHGQITALPERQGLLPDQRGTVGGAVAVGENRLDRLGRGSVRDAVLQVRYISAEGEVVTGGGPVVKNVSGFNLPKLLVGSLGTLGIVAEVVLRTNPLPPVQRWLVGRHVDPTRVRSLLYRPGAVLWNGTDVWVLVEGHEGDVDDETAKLASLGEFAPSEPPPTPPHRHFLTPAEAAQADQRFTGEFLASIGVGTVFADVPAGPRVADPVAAQVAQRAKSLFDPTGRLNPGRSLGV